MCILYLIIGTGFPHEKLPRGNEFSMQRILYDFCLAELVGDRWYILVAGWVRSACLFNLIEVECERNGNTI